MPNTNWIQRNLSKADKIPEITRCENSSRQRLAYRLDRQSGGLATLQTRRRMLPRHRSDVSQMQTVIIWSCFALIGPYVLFFHARHRSSRPEALTIVPNASIPWCQTGTHLVIRSRVKPASREWSPMVLSQYPTTSLADRV